MHEIMNRDEKNQRKQLRNENARLRKKLGIQNQSRHNMEDQTPEMENQFLKNMLAFHEMENEPHIEIRTLFPLNFEFPETDQLSKEALKKKLDDIEDILVKNDIYLDLVEKCPDRIIYQYVLDEVLSNKIAVSRPEGMRNHIDGCGGWCPGCFQQPFCDSWKDTWDEDELKAHQ